MRKFLHTVFLISATIVLTFSCTTLNRPDRSRFVYTIRKPELHQNTLSFSFKNCSTETVSEVTVTVELMAKNIDDEFSEIPQFRKRLKLSLESSEEMFISISIEDFLKEQALDLEEEQTAEDYFDIERIYAEEIAYKNDLLWTDIYGNWCF